MRVLGIETSGEWGGIALWDDRGLVAELTFRHELQLSRLLTSRIRQVLSFAGLEPSSLEGVAVSLGPGSFTGLRIGVTEGKTLAYALDIPLAGIGTLEALAADHQGASTVVALIAASATELFGAVYEKNVRVGDERLAAVDTWLAEIAALDHPQLAGVLGRHRERLSQGLTAARMRDFDALPRAATIALLGRERLLRGASDPTHALVPRYLRLSMPEVRKLQAARQESS
jgi:tRNA threonylcarbamoyladenosine biosynthesis protein TsaB